MPPGVAHTLSFGTADHGGPVGTAPARISHTCADENTGLRICGARWYLGRRPRPGAALHALACPGYRRRPRDPIMTLRLTLASFLLSAPLLPACDSGGGGNDGPDIDCATATVPKFAAMTAWAKCTTCHSSTLASDARRGAPADINYDKYADARAKAQIAMDEVYAGSMPLPGSPALTDEEKTQIYTWASCDTPQ